MTLVSGPGQGAVPVTVWTLEMRDPAALRPGRAPTEPMLLARASPPSAELSRTCYERVGRDWHWVDRREWDDDRWQQWVDRPEHELWTYRAPGPSGGRGESEGEGELAGYVELDRRPDGVHGVQVEVAHFGLLPGWSGRGLGGWLLTQAVRRAWTPAASGRVGRVWLHTCSLDSPRALPTYQSRGFVQCAQTVEWRVLGR